MSTQVDRETIDLRPDVDDDDRALYERLRAGGVRLATGSLDRPRTVAKRRPAWLAFLLTLVGVRG